MCNICSDHLFNSGLAGIVRFVDDAGRERRNLVSRVLSAYDPGEDEPLVTAAIMYYEAHRSQEQIARHLGVSRPTVSRLLARARQLGIVRIQIVPPTVDPAVADDLREKLKLRDVHIAPGLAEPSDPGSVLAGVLD